MLAIVDRCRCSDSFYETFYTALKPNGSYGPKHENVELESDNGMVIVDVVEEPASVRIVVWNDLE